MNESPNNNSSEDLQEEIAVLRHQLVSTLMLVLGIAVIVTWYFAYQFYFTAADSRRVVQAAKEKQTQIEMFTNSEPQFQDFVRKLRDYSKNHPEVAETLKKYGVYQAPAAPATAPKK